MKTLFSEQLSERLSELVGRQNFSPTSRSVFFEIGVAPARQNCVENLGLSQGQTRLVPETFPGSSQEQPDQKVYVHVPFSCLSKESTAEGGVPLGNRLQTQQARMAKIIENEFLFLGSWAIWASGKSGKIRHVQAKSGTLRHFQGHDFA